MDASVEAVLSEQDGIFFALNEEEGTVLRPFLVFLGTDIDTCLSMLTLFTKRHNSVPTCSGN